MTVLKNSEMSQENIGGGDLQVLRKASLRAKTTIKVWTFVFAQFLIGIVEKEHTTPSVSFPNFHIV